MELSTILKSINKTKANLLREAEDPYQEEKDYLPYIVNRCLSYFPDTVLLVNEINQRPLADKLMQYEFLLYSVRPSSRFSPWLKPEKNEDIELLKELYNYNTVRAKEALELLSEQDLTKIREYLDKGGRY